MDCLDTHIRPCQTEDQNNKLTNKQTKTETSKTQHCNGNHGMHDMIFNVPINVYPKIFTQRLYQYASK